ncbi:hydroxymethylpyrimidine/phosphomethylpyrimidine kinase Thi20p [Trichomonascus vanleenenianus]|uniref:hydroxymethylpyrimidine/phosphomethylpyrimidine kinase Thi20p n=1 Tax=Trichomonascus vanleenenianus TaxID=2268995 RepID=UPI003EC996DF
MVSKVLTIAGSDSSGGAGIEADLKTFTAHGCYGMTCITGLTAQNTLGVDAIYPVSDPKFIEKCLDAVFSDVGVDAVKTGMLSSGAIIEVVADRLAKHVPKHIVVDPVMVSTSGAELIPKNAIGSYIEKLIPLATVITPNLVEAQFILEQMIGKSGVEEPKNLDDIKAMARQLYDFSGGKTAVLVKGGHGGMNDEYEIVGSGATKIADVLVDNNGEVHVFENKFYTSTSTHGTGCTLASAIASNLANGDSLPCAVQHGLRYVQNSIFHAFPIGKGHGPVNHFHNMEVRPFQKGHFLDYLLSHPKIAPLWEKYVNHPFTKKLARKDLPQKSFVHFLKQDYIYLKHYSRAHALAGFKADDLDTIGKAAEIIQHIRTEIKLHISYCKEFGVTIEQLESAEEGQACFAYSRYILDIGTRDDWLALQVALSPCLFGYLQAARILKEDPESVEENNPYWRWVENYLAEDFQEASAVGRQILENHCSKASLEKLEQLVDIFATSTKMECGFWDACL